MTKAQTQKPAFTVALGAKTVTALVSVETEAKRADRSRLDGVIAAAKGFKLTEEQFDTELRPLLRKAFEEAGLSTGSNLSKLKIVFLATVAGIKPEKGETYETFYSRAGEPLASAKLADGTYVMRRVTGSTAPAAKRGRKKGAKAPAKAPNSAGTSDAANEPSRADALATSRANSAIVLMGSPKAGADLLRVLEHCRDDFTKFIAAKVAELDESKAKETSQNKGFLKLGSEAADRAAKVARATAAKAQAAKVNGAATVNN